MIDTKKVKLMTRMANYEQSEGQKDIKINQYSKKSYIAMKELESIVSITVVFGLIAVLVMAYLLLAVVSKGEEIVLRELVTDAIVLYLITQGINVIVTRVRAVRRYEKMRRSIEAYEEDLEELHRYLADAEEE